MLCLFLTVTCKGETIAGTIIEGMTIAGMTISPILPSGQIGTSRFVISLRFAAMAIAAIRTSPKGPYGALILIAVLPSRTFAAMRIVLTGQVIGPDRHFLPGRSTDRNEQGKD
jgi:hypothetical protein